MKMAESSPSGSKTLWEKENLLVFKRLVRRYVKTRACLGEGQ